MLQNSDEEQGALILAEAIEDAAKNPEKAAQRMEKKVGAKGILGTIFEFIKDYREDKKQNPDLTNEKWLEQQFAKPKYAEAWKGEEARRTATAQAVIRDIDEYESAKKSLRTHIELGGTRASWLDQQIEIGAANNGTDPAEYAREVSAGLKEAMEENRDFLLGDLDITKEAK